jgi:hypothetical protein
MTWSGKLGRFQEEIALGGDRQGAKGALGAFIR